MEFLRGEPLDKWFERRGRPPIEETLRIARRSRAAWPPPTSLASSIATSSRPIFWLNPRMKPEG